MRLYHIGQKVIATHTNDQAIPASAYGDDVEIVIVPDDTELDVFEEEGEPSSEMIVFYKLPVLSEEENSNQKKELATEKIRTVIASNVGDTSSIVGVLADVTSALIAINLADMVALSGASTFAEYKATKVATIKALSGNADIDAIASEALNKIKSGDVVLTASLKGIENVINDSLSSSTAVAKILIEQSKQSKGAKV